MSKRPDYVACVRTGRWTAPEDVGGQPTRQSWCGRMTDLAEFVFLDATHALLNARNEGRLLICPECSKAMAEVLEKGTFEP